MRWVRSVHQVTTCVFMMERQVVTMMSLPDKWGLCSLSLLPLMTTLFLPSPSQHTWYKQATHHHPPTLSITLSGNTDKPIPSLLHEAGNSNRLVLSWPHYYSWCGCIPLGVNSLAKAPSLCCYCTPMENRGFRRGVGEATDISEA